MTEEEKNILIEKMTGNPDSLTNQDLEAILNDSELREIYEISSNLDGIASSKIEIDGAKEWELFSNRIQKKSRPFRWIMRVAAIFLGILVLSSILIKIVDIVFEQPSTPILTHNNNKEEAAKQKEIKEETHNFAVNNVTIYHENVGEDSKKEVDKTNNSMKNIEVAIDIEPLPVNEIDIDEYLRVQEAKIENELALITAEMYLEEIERIKPELESHGIDEEWMDNEIKKITTQ